MRKLILLLCTALAITAASAQVKRTAKEQKIIDQAIKANTVGNFDEAITLYKKYLKKKPADSEIICYMGNSYYNKKEYETALECYRKAIHHSHIEVALFWSKHILGYIIGDLVDIKRLIPHQIIDGFVFTRFQIAHNTVESNIFRFCH